MSASLLEIDWPVITTIDYMLFGALLPLLGAMAFFSFVEATFFALTPAERLSIRRTHPETPSWRILASCS